MTHLKKYIQAIWDVNRDHQERLFRMFAGMGLLALLAGAVIAVVVRESTENIIASSLAFLFFQGVVHLVIRYRKIRMGANLIGFFIIFILLPVLFLTGGGLYGGSPLYFMFGVVYVCLVVEGRCRYAYIAGSVLMSAACYYIAYYYPELVIQHTRELAYADSFIALSIVSFVICAMILFQNVIYRTENATTQKQKKEIEDLNRAQNEFFSSMSHEIRTPINTIIGLNEMILRDAVSDEVAADARNIQGASKMLLTLINDILDMSKIESGKMEIVPAVYDVGAMLSDIVNMVWVRAKEKGLAFHIDADQSMPAQMFGDEVRVKQILINLLNNAVKYTSEGSVTLSIQCRRLESSWAEVTYSVTDTGIGIKKENIPDLFHAFKRVDTERNRSIEGTGLGLSIVKSLTDLMGGSIAVDSTYMGGSTFAVTLPQGIVGENEIGALDLEARCDLNHRETYKQSFEAPRAHILVVDDNEMNRIVSQKLLRDTKVKVDTASSGQECLRRTLQNRYEVILMDHLMPGMNGIECLHAVRAQTGGLNQDTPVVILTANADRENQALYKREGFDGYLLKPVSGIQLETELLQHLPRELVTVKAESVFAGTDGLPFRSRKKKVPVIITTDSICGIPKNIARKYQIAVIPYRILTDGGEFMDGVEAGTEGILSYMGREGKFVRTQAPATSDYEEFFAAQLTKAQCVVHVAAAQNVSSGYKNALEAARTFDNVIVVDSGHLSSGMGLVVLRAAEYAVAGMAAAAVAEEIKQVQKRVRSSFIIDNTEYLARAGRISPRIETIYRMLMARPVLVMKNSGMKLGAVRFGSKDSAWRNYVSHALKVDQEIDKRVLFIVYAGLSGEELKEIKALADRHVKFEQVIFQKASPVISANCGPGSFGLFFLLK